MHIRTLGLTIVLMTAMLAGSGLVAANHEGGDQCDQLDNALDAIDENADENAQNNSQVERAKTEFEGDHFQDEANDGSDNADDRSDSGSDNADDRSSA